MSTTSTINYNGNINNKNNIKMNSFSFSSLRGHSSGKHARIRVASAAPLHRLLKEQRGVDGSLAILMIVSCIFCFIWAPAMIRRCRIHRQQRREQQLDDNAAAAAPHTLDAREMARFEAEARAVRATLQRMSLVGSMMGNTSLLAGSYNGSSSNNPYRHHGFSNSRAFYNPGQVPSESDNRREFLDNALLTKKVIFQSDDNGQEADATTTDEIDIDTGNNDEDDKADTTTAANDGTPCQKPKKSNLMVYTDEDTGKQYIRTTTTSPSSTKKSHKSIDENKPTDLETNCVDDDDEKDDPQDDGSTLYREQQSPSSPPLSLSEQAANQTSNNTSSEIELEPCSICLVEYCDGDDICWSHNDKCHHFFHKDCIRTWLLTHEDCPCCRQDFLCLWDENGTGDVEGERRRRYQQQYLRSASTTYQRPLRTSSSNRFGRQDWVEELAEELQDRLMQRQRELQYELYRREQLDREIQFMMSMASADAARHAQSTQNHASSLNSQTPQSGLRFNNDTRNSNSSLRVLTMDDIATGLFWHRQVPLMMLSSSSIQESSIQPSQSSRNNTVDNINSDDDDDDVEMAQLESPHGLEPWQTYEHPANMMNDDDPSMLEMAENHRS